MIKTSHSQMEVALVCPFWYYVFTRHRDKMKRTGEARLIGSIVHEVIEKYVLECDYAHAHSKKKQIEWLRSTTDAVFTEYFGKEILAEVKRFQQEYDEAVEHTKELFQRRTGRPSKAPTMCGEWKRMYAARFDELERTIFDPLMAKYPHYEMRTSALGAYQQIQKCIDGFLYLHRGLGKPDRELVEFKLDPRIEIHGSLKGGRVDYIIFNGDSYDVVDFKTGKKYWDIEGVANNPQLLGYAFGLSVLFGYPPRRIGIADLYNHQLVWYTLHEEDIELYKKHIKGTIQYEQRLSRCIDEEGIEATIEKFPLPLGRYGFACPCDLPYEEDETIKCHIYNIPDEEENNGT